MHARSWNRCLAFHPDAGEWCHHRSSDGVFCAAHAREFRCDEAAKAATRLARAELVLRDPSATSWQRWRAARQASRARSLRQALFAAIDGVDGIERTDVDAGIAVTARALLRSRETHRSR
jgi:hypothetical protein